MRDLKKKFGIFFKKTWPFWVILLIVCTFFWKVFLLKQVPLPADFVVGVYYPWLDYKWGYSVGVPVKNPITTDVVSFTYPMQTLAVDFLKKREWPFWNPYILTGAPLLANFQSAPFSPTNFVYFLFDKLTAWSFQIVLQHVLAALFTFILLTSWGIKKFPAVVGGVIFAFSGFNLIWSQWNGHTLSSAFIPLLLYFEDKWIKHGRWKYGVGAAIVLSLQILSGYPQTVFYTVFAMGLLWLFRLRITKEYLLKSLFFAVFLILGLGVAAFQILPGFELLKLSQRAIEPLESSWAFLPWSKVITFVAPDYFGNHATRNYWGPTDYTTTTGFVGVVSIILAGIGISLIKKSKEVKFALSLAVVSLILAFPTSISVWIWQSGIFGMQAASAHRSLVLFNLAIALLAAFGLQKWIKSKAKVGLKYFLLPAAILFGYGLFSLFSYFNPRFIQSVGFTVPEAWKLKVSLRNLIFPTGIFLSSVAVFIASRKNELFKRVGVFLIFGLLIFELFRFGWKFTPFSRREIVYPTTPVFSYLARQERPFRLTATNVIPINIRMAYKLESLEGYDAIYPVDIAQFIATINSEKPGASPQGRYGTVSNLQSHLLDLANTKYLLVLKRNAKGDPDPEGNIPKEFSLEKYKVAYEDKTTVVLENKEVLPRAFMVYDWETVTDRREILRRLLDKDFPLDKKIFLEKKALEPTGQQAANSVSYLKYSEQESILEIETKDDGFLFVSDLFYPGWKAYIDGKESKIYRTNYVFRAVFVPEGEHEVKFVYKPDSFFNGLKVSGLSALSLLMFGFVLGRRKSGSYT